MPKLFRDKYRIKSTRLKQYDYSSCGKYYVTICIKNMDCVLGGIQNSNVQLSDVGRIVKHHWENIPINFSNVSLDVFVIMPNHLHGIIVIDDNDIVNQCRDGVTPSLQRPTLGQIVGYFKYQSTKCINQIDKTPAKQIWQPRFYEHIIRNGNEFNRICEYITNNPMKWELDKNNPKFLKTPTQIPKN